MDIEVSPEGSLEVLSQVEVDALRREGEGGLYPLLRRCALAVLTSGSMTDDPSVLMSLYKDFDITIIQEDRGVRLGLTGAPSSAFVDGKMIRGTRELLFAVLRDIVFFHSEFSEQRSLDLTQPEHITNAVFHVLRHAKIVRARSHADVVVCWGGHAISREEYLYTKQVGYSLGLRQLNVCTGCGPGAMKGPMKGAAIGHAKQRIKNGRYIGISEPGIIAAEAPNPIVNELVIMPDMEKRLEAFVRVAHGIVVFPGGVGTAEEILFLLGVLLHPDNAHIRIPLVFTGPATSAPYFERIDAFVRATLGADAASRYTVVIEDPDEVARLMKTGVADVSAQRRTDGDAFYFNWRLRIDPRFQLPFVATHDNMATLNIHDDAPPHELAANLRRAFSGIVAGNIREEVIEQIRQHGPFQLRGSRRITILLDELLRAFVEQQRMKMSGAYEPCYEVITT